MTDEELGLPLSGDSLGSCRAVASPADLGVPAAYVLGSDDVALPPGEYGWARFADRLGVEPLVVPITHGAGFTEPDVVAESLLKA